MKRTMIFMLACWVCLLGVRLAEANEGTLSAEQLLKNMDKTLIGYDDQFFDAVMTVTDSSGKEKSYSFTTAQKGAMKRLIRFTSGDFKGMAMLIESRQKMFVYLPGMKRVRRVAAHAMNQSFAGSDFTNEDMAATSWADFWNGKLEKEDAEAYYVTVTPKPSLKTQYAYAKIKIAKKGFFQLQTDYYDKNDVYVKHFQIENPKDFGKGLMRHSLITVGDPRTKHQTTLNLKKCEVNQGLKDKMFTVRAMQWGR